MTRRMRAPLLIWLRCVPGVWVALWNWEHGALEPFIAIMAVVTVACCMLSAYCDGACERLGEEVELLRGG